MMKAYYNQLLKKPTTSIEMPPYVGNLRYYFNPTYSDIGTVSSITNLTPIEGYNTDLNNSVTKQPTCETNANFGGKKVFHFDSADININITPAYSMTAPYTIITFVRLKNLTTYNMFIGNAAYPSDMNDIFGYNGDSINVYQNGSGFWNAVPASADTNYCVVEKMDGANSFLEVGGTRVTKNATNSSFLGFRFGYLNLTAKAYIGITLVYEEALSEGNITAIKNWLTTYYT